MEARMHAWLDQEDARTAAMVRKSGWCIEYIGGDTCSVEGCESEPTDDPPFAYTIGLFGLAHPELLILGVSPETAAGVLNSLGRLIRAGEALLPGQVVSVGGWPHRMIPEVVPNPGEIVFAANRYYQRPDEASVPVLQLSYDDVEGRFPWEDGYAVPEMQPRPGTFKA